MKPINEMNASELSTQILSVAFAIHDNRHAQIPDLAWTLEKISDRLQVLTRWIPVSERLPTEEDANQNGLVCTYNEGRTGLCFLGEHGRPKVWHNGIHDYVCFDGQFTHWRRIDKPEAQP